LSDGLQLLLNLQYLNNDQYGAIPRLQLAPCGVYVNAKRILQIGLQRIHGFVIGLLGFVWFRLLLEPLVTHLAPNQLLLLALLA